MGLQGAGVHKHQNPAGSGVDEESAIRFGGYFWVLPLNPYAKP